MSKFILLLQSNAFLIFRKMGNMDIYERLTSGENFKIEATVFSMRNDIKSRAKMKVQR